MVYVDEKLYAFDLQKALLSISEQRREQALRFKNEQGQRLCVSAYLLLKRALKDQEGITENPIFEFGPHGKPSIIGHPELHFSISHCKEAAVCVLSRRPIGIDVESIGRYREAVARYSMSSAEMLRIEQAANSELEFVRLWTMKESLLKLTGEGINDNMKNVLKDIPENCFTTIENFEKNYIYTICEL
jgi:4'-phosphopantetheinyl transferase